MLTPPPQPPRPDVQATAPAERIEALDVLRGAALLGVLLVNLTTVFRVPILQHLLEFHTHPGRANRLVDLLIGVFIESKAFALFSLLFGVGLALQAGRAGRRGRPARLLVRRLLGLLAIGLFHLICVWNGDILVLYAVTALVLLPALALPDRAVLGLALLFLLWPTLHLPWPEVPFAALTDLIPKAHRVYGQGSFVEIFRFRQRETVRLIVPLLGSVTCRTAGLMLLGQYLVRRRLPQEPMGARTPLRWAAALGLSVGLAINCGQAAAAYADVSLGRFWWPLESLSTLLPALGYGALGLLLCQRPGVLRLLAPVAAVGRMALTCYLMQSLVLSLLFYRYGGVGLGLFGQLGAAAVLPLGLGLYALQLVGCQLWLRRFAFGPVEWAWRSVTYGAVQSMRREAARRPM